MAEPDEITSVKGDRIPRKISIDAFAFSAHVDYSQNAEFIQAVNAEHVVSLSSQSRLFFVSSILPSELNFF